MTQPQEVLRNYQQLLTTNNNIQQTSFSSMVVNNTEIQGGNNKISQQTKITQRRKKDVFVPQITSPFYGILQGHIIKFDSEPDLLADSELFSIVSRTDGSGFSAVKQIQTAYDPLTQETTYTYRFYHLDLQQNIIKSEDIADVKTVRGYVVSSTELENGVYKLSRSKVFDVISIVNDFFIYSYSVIEESGFFPFDTENDYPTYIGTTISTKIGFINIDTGDLEDNFTTIDFEITEMPSEDSPILYVNSSNINLPAPPPINNILSKLTLCVSLDSVNTTEQSAQYGVIYNRSPLTISQDDSIMLTGAYLLSPQNFDRVSGTYNIEKGDVEYYSLNSFIKLSDNWFDFFLGIDYSEATTKAAVDYLLFNDKRNIQIDNNGVITAIVGISTDNKLFYQQRSINDSIWGELQETEAPPTEDFIGRIIAPYINLDEVI